MVIDRAKYHTTLTEKTKPAQQSWRKEKSRHWLKARRVVVPDDWPEDWEKRKTKVQIYGLARENKPKPSLMVQDIGKRYNIEFLSLMVAHPELNLIEMVWSCIKRKCATRNLNFRLAEVENIAREEMAKITSTEFCGYERHVMGIEPQYWDHIRAQNDL